MLKRKEELDHPARGCQFFLFLSRSAGIMWQALSSKDQASYLQNLYMLPLENRKLVLSYVSALGSYTLLTKTAALLSVAFAVSIWTRTEVLGSFLCAVHAALFAAVLFSFRIIHGQGVCGRWWL